jgi:purine-binding chemotaxis protein CheW
MNKKSRIKTTLDSLFTGGKPPSEDKATIPANKPSVVKRPAAPKKKETVEKPAVTANAPAGLKVESPAVVHAPEPAKTAKPEITPEPKPAIAEKPTGEPSIQDNPIPETKPLQPPAETLVNAVISQPVTIEKAIPAPVQDKKIMDEEKMLQLAQSIDRASGSQSQEEEHLVIFSLGKELYGVTIHTVESIIKLQAITQVPKTAAFILGVTNLRGTVVPVLDLRIRFNLPLSEKTANTRIVIVNTEGSKVGIVVDEVTEVLKVPRNTIQPPPPLSTTIESSFINGIARIDDRLVILLDLEKVLASSSRPHNR